MWKVRREKVNVKKVNFVGLNMKGNKGGGAFLAIFGLDQKVPFV